MSAYKIKFINNSTGSGNQDFTLYSVPPAISSSRGTVRGWSNSFLNRKVLVGATWNMTIGSAPLAFCGTSRTPLEPGVDIDVSMTQHATLGAHGNGSTHLIYNSGGIPAFQEEESYTAPTGAYEIVTGNDFAPNLNWVAGYALSDGNGIARPAATFTIDTNTKYAVAPPPAPRLILGNFASSPGTLINPEMLVSQIEIDFAQHPGQPNALVTRDSNGIYFVEYMTQAVFAMRAASSDSATQNPQVQLSQLKHQVKIMSDLIDTALGISQPTLGEPTWGCSFKWTKSVPAYQKFQIAGLLAAGMTARGYTLKNRRLDPDLTLTFTHPTQENRTIVYFDWLQSWAVLPSQLKQLLTSPNVIRILFEHADASSAEAFTTSSVETDVLRPNFQCSVDWLEGPSKEGKQAITDILSQSMERQEYYVLEKKITDESLVLDVWHLQPWSVEETLGSWETAVKSLDSVLLRNYVTNAKADGIVYTAMNGTSNGADTASDFPPFAPTYACFLTWLEGPNEKVKEDIHVKLSRAMLEKGYRIQNWDLGGEKLRITVSPRRSSDTDHVLSDWIAAWNTLEFQKMYVYDPQCEEIYFATNDKASTSMVGPIPATYICSLDWLEGPPPNAQKDILEKLEKFMLQKLYFLLAMNSNDKHASISFFHGVPHDLPVAQADWTAACDSLGFQRMYVTNEKCEPAYNIQAGNIPVSGAKQAGSTDPNNATNGTNGATSSDPPTVGPAPEVEVSSMQRGESIEEKKRRALALLQAEGLIGFGGSLVAA